MLKKTFFPLSLTMRPNKLEGLSLETLSSHVLEFEGKARANSIGAPFRCFFLDEILVLPKNVRPDWKEIVRCKHSSLLGLVISNEGKSFITLTPGYRTNSMSSLQLITIFVTRLSRGFIGSMLQYSIL